MDIFFRIFIKIFQKEVKVGKCIVKVCVQTVIFYKLACRSFATADLFNKLIKI
jgi:hypothetical protein